MKRIVLSLILVTSSLVIFAQDNPVVTKVTVSTNPAYTVPFFIRSDFETRNPGVTVLMWEPVDVWWRASYNNNNRITHVYYNTAGFDYTVSLPVITGFVPEEAITKAIKLYGNSIYGITRMKSANGSDVYQVRLLADKQTKTMWMNTDGNTVSEVEVFKAKEM